LIVYEGKRRVPCKLASEDARCLSYSSKIEAKNPQAPSDHLILEKAFKQCQHISQIFFQKFNLAFQL